MHLGIGNSSTSRRAVVNHFDAASLSDPIRTCMAHRVYTDRMGSARPLAPLRTPLAHRSIANCTAGSGGASPPGPALLFWQYGKVGSTKTSCELSMVDVPNVRNERASTCESSFCASLPPRIRTHSFEVARQVLHCHQNNSDFWLWSVSRQMVTWAPSFYWENSVANNRKTNEQRSHTAALVIEANRFLRRRQAARNASCRVPDCIWYCTFFRGLAQMVGGVPLEHVLMEQRGGHAVLTRGQPISSPATHNVLITQAERIDEWRNFTRAVFPAGLQGFWRVGCAHKAHRTTDQAYSSFKTLYAVRMAADVRAGLAECDTRHFYPSDGPSGPGGVVLQHQRAVMQVPSIR